MSFVPSGAVLHQRISIKIDYVYLKNAYLQLSKHICFIWRLYVFLTRYPVISSSSGVVHATSRLSDPTRLVTLKLLGVIRVGLTPAEFKSGYFLSSLASLAPIVMWLPRGLVFELLSPAASVGMPENETGC